MAWIYFQGLVESDSRSSHGLEQSPIANKTDTHNVFYCRECDQVTLTELPFGTTCEPCERRYLEANESTLFSEAFRNDHVKISALLELERAWEESEVAFSSKLSGSSKKYDQLSSFLKTSLQSGQEDLIVFASSWPRAGMISGGQLSVPQALELRTSERGGSCWPTPTICGNYQNKGNMIGLATAVKSWATPCARDWKDTGSYEKLLQRKDRHSDSLPVQVMRSQGTGGQLSPQWVDWLMGYRIGYTELSALETALFRSKSGKRSKNLLELKGKK